MKNIEKKRPVLSCVILFVICGLARIIEYFVIKTDETIIAENFVHKAFGIAVLAIILHSRGNTWKNIGFIKGKRVSDILKGFLLGGCCFLVAYSIECLMLYQTNQNVSFAFYISGFTLNGEAIRHDGFLFLLLCIVLNIINVWMEEGIFRGLFMKILAEKLSFIRAVLLIAFLFGIWHWVMPLRDYAQGNISLADSLIMGIGYIVLAGIMSIKWSFLYKMTGALWMGLGDHLLNNVIVTNLLHVISNGEADSMQIIRIMIGQMLSFSIITLCYRKSFDDGLVFLKSSERGKCFIEYIPSENAWVPVIAENYMYIDCFWVSGSFKGHGYSNDLLNRCIEDSKAKGKSGLCILSSAKKKPFLSDPRHLLYKGFRVADTSDAGISLMYLPFDEKAAVPRFTEAARHPHIEEQGYVLYYTNQCPFNGKYVPIVERTAAENNIPFKAIRI